MKHYSILIILVFIANAAHAQDVADVYTQLETNYNENNFEACLKMEKAVEAFAERRVDTLASNSFFYLGDAHYQSGQISRSLDYFERSKQILEKLGYGETAEYSDMLSNLAYLYLMNGNYDRAGQVADQLIVVDRKLYSASAPEWIESVIWATDIFIELDRLRDAERLLLQVSRSQKKDSYNRGVLLNKLGELYSYTGEYTSASRSLLESLEIHWNTSGEESAEYINAAINLGILYMNQGKYPDAEEIFEVALTKVGPSQPGYTPLLNNYALVLQSLGQLERAEKTFHTIREIDSTALGTDHPDFAITLSNLGLVYGDLGKSQEAEVALTKALAIQKANGESNSLSYARKLNNLAKVRNMAGQSQESVLLLKQALAIFRKNMGRKSPEYATAAYNLGVALLKTGKSGEAYRYLKRSADIRLRALGKHHPKYGESIQKIGEIHWSKNDIEKAHELFGLLFENHFHQVEKTFPVLTEEEKSKFYYTNIRDSFDKFCSFAIENHTRHPGLIRDVYEYLVNTKSAIMLATEKVRSSIVLSGDTALIQRFERWQSTKEQIARSYSLNQEHKDLDSLTLTADRLEKELARASSVFEEQFVKERITSTQIQSALKAGEAAVEVLRYKKYNPVRGGTFSDEIAYALLVITSDTERDPHLIEIPGGLDLEGKYLKYYRNNIKYRLEDTESFERYFQQVAAHLKESGIQRVFISPDGVYNQINISSLLNPQTGRFVLDEIDIRMVTNTREVAETKITPGIPGNPALIGSPTFNLDTTQIAHPAPAATTPGINRAWRGGLLRYMRGEEISPLPGTKVEIEKIAQFFGETAEVHTQENATEAVTRNVNNPDILHIATHGYFLEDQVRDGTTNYFSNPLLDAGLILAGAENFLRAGQPLNEYGDDGILTAYEAMNLRLDNTRLVVLSACETALGDVKNGEGVYGLQRAFKLAGSESIIMSLWTVDDEATQHLMTTFYEKMQQSKNLHEAFRLAQQAAKERYPSPFYWGAFIMVGI